MTVVVRPYAKADIEEIILMVGRALPALPNYQTMHVEPERLRYVLNHNLTNATFFCLVAVAEGVGVVGGIAAYCTPTIFSMEVVATDTFMWIDPEYRALATANKLLHGYIEWATSRRAKRVMASHTSGLNAEGMEALLARAGFEKVGAIFHLK